VPRPREPPVRLLEVLQGGIAVHLEDVVVVHRLRVLPNNHKRVIKT
jgi:hypothetical protein